MAKQFMDDNELVILYQSGNEQALETLITRHKKKLFSYIYLIVRNRELAEDIFQDAFFKVIQTIKKGQYQEEGKFYAWIKCISHNLIVDHFRKSKRLQTVSGGRNSDGEEFDIFDVINITDENTEDKVLRSELRKDLKFLIDLLPMEQKEVLYMRHYLDMSFKEISELTKVSLNTSLGRMRYALINLRKLAKENNVLLEG